MELGVWRMPGRSPDAKHFLHAQEATLPNAEILAENQPRGPADKSLALYF